MRIAVKGDFKMKRLCIYGSITSLLIMFIWGNAFADSIICASTTSTENSGLFDHLLPLFKNDTGIEVKVVARGTGAALEMGRRGDADVVLVHAKEQELQAVAEGFFVDRHDVMYNDFIIIGPPDDPASIKGIASTVEALKKIADQQAVFVSRGDQSGTHTKELAIWKQVNIDPVGNPWYLEVGQGMEKTQRIGDEKRAYVLTDRGTWLATRDKLEMEILLEGDPILFNQYGVMAVNPEKHPHVKYEQAMEFIRWMISETGQAAIAGFRDKQGNPLFIPNAK
jgi:tungstate transport system substrate-binding protein